MTARESFAAVLLAGILVIALVVGGWSLYWWTQQHGIENRYEVNTHSQQFQSGLISQERDRAQAYGVATDPGQRAQIKATFCQVFPDLSPAPADIQLSASTIGC